MLSAPRALPALRQNARSPRMFPKREFRNRWRGKDQPSSNLYPKVTIKTSMSNLTQLEHTIEHWFAQGPAAIGDTEALTAFQQLREALEAGTLRSAQPDPSAPTGWRVNAWVKRGILLGFRLGHLVSVGNDA